MPVFFDFHRGDLTQLRSTNVSAGVPKMSMSRNKTTSLTLGSAEFDGLHDIGPIEVHEDRQTGGAFHHQRFVHIVSSDGGGSGWPWARH